MINVGADSLCGRLVEKISSTHNIKLVLAHMPLLMVCLEVSFELTLRYLVLFMFVPYTVAICIVVEYCHV